jgi:hypothetical protein
MLPNALAQMMDTLLRLPLLEAAQLRELIQHLPDPQAAAQEMVRRGWITQDQLSSLFPDPQQRPTPGKTMLLDVGDDESPPDADGDNWDLIVSDEEDRADVPPEAERAQADGADEVILLEPETVEQVPVLTGAVSTPQFEKDVPVPVVAGGNADHRQESGTGKLPRKWLGRVSKGLLIGTLFLGSLFAGLPFFGANSTAPPVPSQESREAGAGDPARTVDLPPVPQNVPINKAKPRDDLPNGPGQNAPPAAPVADPPAARAEVPPAPPVPAEAPVPAKAPERDNDARPKSTASLYARVRQAVLENKTEETQRLGIGDFAYQDVPDDGSIMVGMAVTYAPFFNHQIIKSVRPIYQRPDGKRYYGRVCGNPTRVGERVVAREAMQSGGQRSRPAWESTGCN